ncbi:DUF4197 domain-containing protein [Viridibacterium curvum]|uniref:DUF4197 domain-containing protein n=1 Tax=Viridibacterium curvum TaxID=1101404 RepID=A0ABP9QQV0_9RHOO
MQRRHFLAALAFSGLSFSVRASLLDALSSKDASAGLKQALEQGAGQAVAMLGAKDGFFASDRFRLPLPDSLQQLEPVLRTFGQGAALDELHLALNRAAETAVSEARPLLVGAVKSMSVQDAKGILTGGDDSVTQFFRGKTFDALTQKFLPVVSKVVAGQKLAERYDRIARQASKFGLISQDDAQLDRFVTRRALDALYMRIGDEEKAIRENPAQAVGKLAKKVFGAL